MSQEQTQNSPTITGTNLTSKFLRKAKFRGVPATQSEEGESIPKASKLPDDKEVVDTDAQIHGSPANPSQTPDDQEGVKEELEFQVNDSEMDPLGSNELEGIPEQSSPTTKLEINSPTIPPKADENSLSLPSLPYRATSLEPSVSDVTDIVSSSPQSSSTDFEIRPPEAEEEDTAEEDTSTNAFIPFTPEELDQAKTLVLDLLGWGVDPEYLVTSGVSPEMIFRVFSDLNLHLPKNLRVSEELIAAAYSWGSPPEFAQSVG